MIYLLSRDMIPKPVMSVLVHLLDAGHDAYLAGGCIRDHLLGKEPKDYDIATDCLPTDVLATFSGAGYKVIPTGIQYGTITVVSGGMPVEVTTFRADGNYSDGRRPDVVTFSKSIEEDLARRDFTMNAIAWSLDTGLVDPFGGRHDLLDGFVRAVGNPDNRFKEDALRMLRAIRFTTVLDFVIHKGTFDAIFRNAQLLYAVSHERTRDELNKILLSSNPGRGLAYLHVTSLLTAFLPELVACYGFDQHNPNHRKSVFDHILAVVDGVTPVLHMRLAALLHDIAKPKTFIAGEDGVGHFYGHEDEGAIMATTILRRLKYDCATIDKVTFLVKEHMFPATMGRKGIRRFVARAGEHLEDLLTLRAADAAAGKTPSDVGYLDTIRQVAADMQIEGVRNPEQDLAINGHDIMDALEIKPGPEVGMLLNRMRDLIVDNPEMNDRQQLLGEVRRCR